ncbi:MAG: AbrB/MazE/SpoVT family DNA-binding domain-containing protein [Desulfobacterales bacterium]
MRITSQGQIALPQEVTEKLGFLPDTEIEYQIEGNLLLLRKREKSEKGSALISLMKGSANTGMTTDQIMKLTRGE